MLLPFPSTMGSIWTTVTPCSSLPYYIPLWSYSQFYKYLHNAQGIIIFVLCNKHTFRFATIIFIIPYSFLYLWLSTWIHFHFASSTPFNTYHMGLLVMNTCFIFFFKNIFISISFVRGVLTIHRFCPVAMVVTVLQQIKDAISLSSVFLFLLRSKLSF